MSHFRLLAAAVTLSAFALVTACAEAEPEPTPTGFATEEEAFDAARATYEAYIEADNAIDLSNPSTFEPIYDLSTGDAYATSRENLTRMHAEKHIKTGESVILSFTLRAVDLDRSTVVADVCLDGSDVQLLDADGRSLVQEDRPDIHALRVEFTDPTHDGRLRIAHDSGRTDGPSCE